MVVDPKLVEEEARRMRELEAVKSRAEREVLHEVNAATTTISEADKARARQLAETMKGKAVSEVVQTEEEVIRARRIARISQFVNYGFGIVYGVIGLEIALELLGAREGTGFKEFVDALSAPLLEPFRGLMMEPEVGAFAFRTSFVVAVIVYMLIHAAITGLLKVMALRATEL
jgi:uncharacterized protein YggT (Ycf19 family)